MKEVTDIISKHHSEDLERLLNETSEFNEKKKSHLMQIWELDIKNRKQFYDDQKQNGNGNRGNKWNMITYRLALAVYVRSPAAYKALKSFQILSLPSKRSLQKFMSHKLDNPGESDAHLKELQSKYAAMCEDLDKNGKPSPDGFGALIFDEVKVISKVMWNSRNNTVIGYAMTYEEMTGLHDIYMQLDTAPHLRKTNYVIQFLWRDLCSSFDVLGPYYTSENSLENKFIEMCILDAIFKMN